MPFCLRKKLPEPNDVLVVLASLPKDYRKSVLYKKSREEGLTTLKVPRKFLYLHPDIRCIDDLVAMLYAIVYWEFATPTSVYEFCTSHFVDIDAFDTRVAGVFNYDRSMRLKGVWAELKAIRLFMADMVECNDWERCYTRRTLECLMDAGVPLIQFLDKTFHSIRGGKEAWMIAAAKYGKLDRIRCLHKLGYPVPDAAITVAKKHGFTNCARLLRSFNGPMSLFEYR